MLRYKYVTVRSPVTIKSPNKSVSFQLNLVTTMQNDGYTDPWSLFNFALSFFQPTRLNVMRNDSESYDFTNPNLSKYAQIHGLRSTRKKQNGDV